jgi:hypothetical protein
LIEQFVGLRTFGGSESCDATKMVAAKGDGGFALSVHHDDLCPGQSAREGRL